MRSLVRYGKFLQFHADVSKFRIIQPVDLTGQEDALQRDPYINTPAVKVTVCINHIKLAMTAFHFSQFTLRTFCVMMAIFLYFSRFARPFSNAALYFSVSGCFFLDISSSISFIFS